MGSRLSITYPVRKRMKQGSVWHLHFFGGPGSSYEGVAGFWARAIHQQLHVDDVRTSATSKESLEAKVAMVKNFAERNFLKLDIDKCEVLMLSKDCSVDGLECVVDGSVLPAGDVRPQVLRVLVEGRSASNQIS